MAASTGGGGSVATLVPTPLTVQPATGRQPSPATVITSATLTATRTRVPSGAIVQGKVQSRMCVISCTTCEPTSYVIACHYYFLEGPGGVKTLIATGGTGGSPVLTAQPLTVLPSPQTSGHQAATATLGRLPVVTTTGSGTAILKLPAGTAHQIQQQTATGGQPTPTQINLPVNHAAAGTGAAGSVTVPVGSVTLTHPVTTIVGVPATNSQHHHPVMKYKEFPTLLYCRLF